MTRKRFYKTIFFSWLVFLGIDFLFHAGLFQSLWKEPLPAFLPEKELYNRIPFGYASFLLLTCLLGFLYIKVYNNKVARKELFLFAVIVAILFAAINFLSLYSFTTIPLKQLAVFNLAYFIEIIIVVYTINKGICSDNFKRFVYSCLLLFFATIIFGILFQNILSA